MGVGSAFRRGAPLALRPSSAVRPGLITGIYTLPLLCLYFEPIELLRIIFYQT